ncbi:MAG: hypothetical protein GX895_08030 [Clostridiales bacterium]|uniref:hypothetical protein n=1 Tax=Clostridium sp. N3C TaxID=1776758 RepID=UPI00092DEC12|nr:hypothetical protein [Clostridium sp. N3C]NLZ48723.1 hypothetical protein [Clostridiales bacterium]SCN21254.1 hypothetical protein N3C_0030 [Clostridium sp. N3C]
MQDTYLLDKISNSIKEICNSKNIKRIREFTIVVNHNSDVNEENLRKHLTRYNKEHIGEEIKIKIQREDIEEETAIIHSIQGENA